MPDINPSKSASISWDREDKGEGKDKGKGKSVALAVTKPALGMARIPHYPTPIFEVLSEPTDSPFPRQALRQWLEAITDTSDHMCSEADLAHLPALMGTTHASLVLDVLGRRMREPYPSNLKALDAASWIDGEDLRKLRDDVRRLLYKSGEVRKLAGIVLESIDKARRR